MTCPKTPYNPGGTDDFSAGGNFGSPDVFVPAEITNAETERVRKLLLECGL
jgi:hypothetical protein